MIIIFSFLFLTTLDSTEIFLWTHNMHDSTKQSHREHESHKHCQSNDKSKCLEEHKVGEVKEESAHESSDAPTQDADTHLSVGLLHLKSSGWL